MSPQPILSLAKMLKIFTRKMALVAGVKPKPKEVSNPDAFGLKELVAGKNPIIDIVAIHGLNGHRENSWTAENGVNWLTDLLPEQTPNARIFSYGYDSRILGDALSRQHLHNHGVALITDLSLTRRSTQTERRPIIFIAHSLGGIVCKSGLIYASMTNEGHLHQHKDIHLSTYGIMFFGTPHQGGNGVSLAISLVNIASVFTKTNQNLLKHLEKNSEMLEKLTQEFNSISSRFDTKFLYETYETPTPLGPKLLVPKHSAVVPGAINAEEIAINRNHREMVKFISAEDEAFRKVYLSINIMVTNALPHIAQSQRQLNPVQQEIEVFESLR